MINKEEIFLEFNEKILPVLLRKLKEEHLLYHFMMKYEKDNALSSDIDKQTLSKHIESEYEKIMVIINMYPTDTQLIFLSNYDNVTKFSYSDFTNHKDNFFILIIIRFLKRTCRSHKEVTKWCNEVFQQLNLKKHD